MVGVTRVLDISLELRALCDAEPRMRSYLYIYTRMERGALAGERFLLWVLTSVMGEGDLPK